MKGRSQSSSIPIRRFNSRRRTGKGAEVWTVRRAVAELLRHGDKRNVEGMARFGIRSKKVLGVSKPQMDGIARSVGKNHSLGLKLWNTGIHDARLLGMLICDPECVTSAQMERWVRDFDNWDVCDGTCCHLFVGAKLAWEKAFSWTSRDREFEKRAGFALAAYLAIHDKAASDAAFQKFLKTIEREASDERNFVRKAVNWALRNIGKRNRRLNRAAIQAAERIQRGGTRTGRWIAADALRELQSARVQKCLLRKANGSAVSETESIKIRKVKQIDAERIAALSGQLGYPATTKEMTARLKCVLKMKHGACFVAETKEAGVIGWVHVSVTPLLEVVQRAEVNGLVVDEKVRSHRAGSRLLEAAEHWARKTGCQAMSVRSNVIRAGAHGFYLKQGYEHYKTQKAFRKTLQVELFDGR